MTTVRFIVSVAKGLSGLCVPGKFALRCNERSLKTDLDGLFFEKYEIAPRQRQAHIRVRFVKSDEELVAVVGTEDTIILSRLTVITDICRINERPFVLRERPIVGRDIDEFARNGERNILQPLNCSMWGGKNLCDNNQVFQVFGRIKVSLRGLIWYLRLNLYAFVSVNRLRAQPSEANAFLRSQDLRINWVAIAENKF